jgi:hypothetical protein
MTLTFEEYLQAERQEGIRKQAELDAFERHNVAAASSSATDAIARQGEVAAAREGERVAVEASGHAIRVNEDRARNVKVSKLTLYLLLHTPDCTACIT